MRNRRHLVVFVRAPQFGAVKRRLAAGIGAPAALRFYAATTAALLRRVAGDTRWTTWLAVTPDRFAARGRFWPRGLRRLGQGGGDLGARMGRMLCRFGAPTAIVGSDIPELGADQVAAAFAALDRAELVFGPAEDGGYWLVGTRHPGAARGLFRRVRWSGPHALADTRANAAGRRVRLLAPLADVDDAADLMRARSRAKKRAGAVSAR